ncbi:MAG: hypothetical protein ACOC24_07090, partial [Desulfovibrionales bacterium]
LFMIFFQHTYLIPKKALSDNCPWFFSRNREGYFDCNMYFSVKTKISPWSQGVKIQRVEEMIIGNVRSDSSKLRRKMEGYGRAEELEKGVIPGEWL